MRLYLIRHGATKGNKEHRYVGITDEGLLPGAKKILEAKKVGQADILYVSPLKRCRETAAILYPGKEQIIIEDMRECSFGEFEYKNYLELSASPDYQKFIDSKGESGFPGGETLRSFQDRCVRVFEQTVKELFEKEREQTAAFVIHGGTIMAILDHYSRPHKDYYDWWTENGEGYEMSVIMEEGGFYLGDIRKI